MRNFIATAGLLALFACVTGCGKSAAGAPSDAEVETAARQQFAQQLSGAEVSQEDRKAYRNALAAAKFAPDPQCVKGSNEVYACVLEMTATMPGDSAPTQQPVMVELVKSGDGWRAAPMH